MKWNDFDRAIAAGRFESVYLFTGDEEQLKREALESLKRKLVPTGMEMLNITTLEDCTASEIIAEAMTLPLMCDRRVVVVRDWGPLTEGKARNEADDVKVILEWIKDAPDTCTLVFYVAEKFDRKKKLSAALMKMPGNVEFDYLKGAALAKWCNQYLHALNKRISNEAMNEFIMIASKDLARISGELSKLAAYTGSAPEISAADVRAVVTPSPEYSVFKILDHLLMGEMKEATEVVNGLARTDSDIWDLIRLLEGQLRINAHAKSVIEANGNVAELFNSLGVDERRAYHVQRQIRPIAADALRERYLHCVEADYAIKSGQMRARAALDMLLLKIVMPPSATKPGRYSSNR